MTFQAVARSGLAATASSNFFSAPGRSPFWIISTPSLYAAIAGSILGGGGGGGTPKGGRSVIDTGAAVTVGCAIWVGENPSCSTRMTYGKRAFGTAVEKAPDSSVVSSAFKSFARGDVT